MEQESEDTAVGAPAAARAEATDAPDVDTDAGGASRSDLLLVAALLLPLLILAGIFGYRAVAESGPGFECTPEHQALGHC